jgi:hypothetical protein
MLVTPTPRCLGGDATNDGMDECPVRASGDEIFLAFQKTDKDLRSEFLDFIWAAAGPGEICPDSPSQRIRNIRPEMLSVQSAY